MAPRNTATLSPLDQLMPRVYTRIFLTFATNEVTTAVHRLNVGLDQTCHQIPFLKGHVSALPGSSGRLAISWADSDPVPSLQKIDAADRAPSYASVVEDGAQLHHFQNWMCPVDSLPNHSTPDTKAAAVAISYIGLDGGLIICICVHHNVMDGTGMGDLISLWAANCKGKDAEDALSTQAIDPTEPLSRYSNLTTGLAAAMKQTEGIPQEELLQRRPEYRLMSSLPSPDASQEAPKVPESTSKIFEFPVSRIVETKAALSGLTEANSASLSTNNVLSALIWSFVSRARSSHLKDELKNNSKLGFAINGRKHLGTDFANNLYFGNVNLFGLASAPFHELTLAGECRYADVLEKTSLQGLVSIASEIHHSISKINPAHISEVVSLVDKSPNAADIIPGWNFWNGPDLSMTSWANLRLYECDFGEALGRPDFVRVPYVEVDGLVIILPRRAPSLAQPHGEGATTSQESFEVVVMLRKDDMVALENDDAWNSWTSAS